MQTGPHTLHTQTLTLSCSLGRDSLLLGKSPWDDGVMGCYWLLPQERFGHRRVKRSRGACSAWGRAGSPGTELRPSFLIFGMFKSMAPSSDRGLTTRHWGPAQAFLSCLPGEMTLPVVGRAYPWPLA